MLLYERNEMSVQTNIADWFKVSLLIDWGAHEIWGHGEGEPLALYDKYTYFTKEEEAER